MQRRGDTLGSPSARLGDQGQRRMSPRDIGKKAIYLLQIKLQYHLGSQGK